MAGRASQSRDSVPRCSQLAVEHIAKEYLKVRTHEPVPSSDEALRTLLLQSSAYGQRTDTVILPRSLWRRFHGLIVGLLRLILESFFRITPLCGCGIGESTCLDLRLKPQSFASSKEFKNLTYGEFLHELHRRGLVKFERAHGREGNLGIFFVYKKDREKIRLIFDTRILNTAFVDPPSTRLPSSSSFSNMEVPSDSSLWVSTADISNCFYRMGVPDDLGRCFSLPTLAAHHIDPRIRAMYGLGENDRILPHLRVLPMGWSWSLHLCQNIVAGLMQKHFPPCRMIGDKREAVVLSRETKLCGASYVDNLAVFGLSREDVDNKMDEIISTFSGKKLLIHEVEVWNGLL
eukprot:5718871-Amphidinium_carterae.1